ncbi:MAG TPA: cupin domain-containing protein [Oscillatoriaceae cyanobacterium]
MTDRTIRNPVEGIVATFHETARDTNGALTRIEFQVQPGGGPPLHYHTEFDEEIVALEGPLAVTIGKETRVLQTGERVSIPRGVPHTWRNATADEVSFEARMVPATHGFENVLRALAGLAQDGELNQAALPKDFKTLALLASWGDTHLPGPMGMLAPMLGWMARRAEKSGLGDRLRQRYGCDMPPVASSRD